MQVEKFLKQHGFVYSKTKGSHCHYDKSTVEREFSVVVPKHGGKSIPIGTMYSIVRQSGVPQDEWKKGKQKK